MGWSKRCVFRFWHYRVQMILLILAFGVLSGMIFFLTATNQKLQAKSHTLADTVPAAVAVCRGGVEWIPYHQESYLPNSFLEQLEEEPEVIAAHYMTQISCHGIGLEAIIPDAELNSGNEETFWDSEEEKTAGKINVVGVTETVTAWDFEKNNLEILEGRGITEADQASLCAVISQRLQQKNKLELGDQITVQSGFDPSIQLTLTIVGIHSGNYGSRKAYYSGYNKIYIPIQTASLLNNGGLLEAKYTISSANALDSFLKTLDVAQAENNISLELLKDSRSYLLKSGSVESLRGVTTIVLFALWLVCIVLILFFIFYSLQDRKREIAVLRALGVSRSQLLLQLTVDYTVPIAAGFLLGAGGQFVLGHII